MALAKVIAEGDAPHALGEIGRAVARIDEIPDNGFERTRTLAGAHQPDLCARPVEDLCSYGMSFGRIAVEQAGRRIATNGRRELPSEIHGIAEAEIQALAAQRRMDVCGVTRQQYAVHAIVGCLI